jgi:hypothetical protein
MIGVEGGPDLDGGMVGVAEAATVLSLGESGLSLLPEAGHPLADQMPALMAPSNSS